MRYDPVQAWAQTAAWKESKWVPNIHDSVTRSRLDVIPCACLGIKHLEATEARKKKGYASDVRMSDLTKSSCVFTVSGGVLEQTDSWCWQLRIAMRILQCLIGWKSEAAWKMLHKQQANFMGLLDELSEPILPSQQGRSTWQQLSGPFRR
jgi:hypothetical protein